MCRRCGEGDKRGSARDRRARKRYLLTYHGDGTSCLCWWCDVALSFFTLTVDRLIPGGSYARWNILPACIDCNIGRSDLPAEEWCVYG